MFVHSINNLFNSTLNIQARAINDGAAHVVRPMITVTIKTNHNFFNHHMVSFSRTNRNNRSIDAVIRTLLLRFDNNNQFTISDFTMNSVKNLLVCDTESDNEFFVEFGKCVCHSVTSLFLLHHII